MLNKANRALVSFGILIPCNAKSFDKDIPGMIEVRDGLLIFGGYL